MNGIPPTQLHIDFRTGRETGIPGARVSAGDRAACSALNRQRAKGIEEATRQTPSRESLSADVWAALVAARAREWGVPLVPLKYLGLSRDRDGMMASAFLRPLKSGAEACPYADLEWKVVYKLFPLSANGGLGKTFSIERDEDDAGFSMNVRDAILAETIGKLMALHDAGAHPTEIVGLDETGDHLIVKQPLAEAYGDLDIDRDATLKLIDDARSAAVISMHAVLCKARFKRPVWIIWSNDRAWVLSDLHPGNVMKNVDGTPCIIDALLATLSPAIINADRCLVEAVEDALALRENRTLPRRKKFDEGFDAEL